MGESDMNSPNLQPNLVDHIVDICQRLKGNIQTGNQENV